MLRTQQAYWTLAFISPTEIEDAARELLNATSKFNRYERDSRNLRALSGKDWETGRNRYFQSRRRLIAAMKAERAGNIH